MAPTTDIAITGMACLFPGADSPAAFWANITGARDAISDAPAGWEMSVLYDPTSDSAGRVYANRGGWLGTPTFDALRHGVLPNAARGGEADQWLALEVARQALEDAGVLEADAATRARTGVVLGKGNYINRGNATMLQHGLVLEQTLAMLQQLRPDLTPDDIARIREQLAGALPPFDADTVSGLIPNITASRIANRLDLMGPTYTIDAACASSLIAIEHAAQYLRSGQCDQVLAGGVHVTLPGPIRQVFCQLGALSRTQQIRPFDLLADGTLPGDGVGMVLLKRLDDAQRDGDRIYAVVKGVGVSSDGRGLSVMAPRGDGERLALQRAYAAAHVDPRTVQLIEAHGTGTAVGDPTEVGALQAEFGARERDLPWCAIGTVKSMLGHLMPAAGIAGVIKTALALHHKVLPPTLNVSEPIAPLADRASAFYVNTATRPWVAPAAGHPRRAGVNAFGFGGVNAHVVLEEAPTPPAGFVSVTAERDAELCLLHGDTREALVQACRALAAAPADQPLHVLAQELAQRQPYGAQRLAIVATSHDDLQAKLARALTKLEDAKTKVLRDPTGIYYFAAPPAQGGKLALLFPGEGSQYEQQLGDLYPHLPSVRRWMDRANRAFAGEPTGALPGEFLYPSPLWSADERAVAKAKLWSLDGAVSAVLSADTALLDVLRATGLHPDGMLGHSTGELVALFASGMIDIDDDARAEQFTSELFAAWQAMPRSSGDTQYLLAAVGADARTVRTVAEQVGGTVMVAMDNCSLQAVLSGERSAVERAVSVLQARGVLCERLEFDRPYHTPGFAPFVGPVRELMARWITAPPRVPTWSCATRAPFPQSLPEIRDVAITQWTAAVEFTDTIRAMHADGFRTFVEVGARGNLSSFVDDILRGAPHLCIPLNLATRSGMTQLCHAFGMLLAAGYTLDPAPLWAHRAPAQAAARSRAAVTLALEFPRMTLDAVSVPAAPAPVVTSAAAPAPGAPAPQAAPPKTAAGIAAPAETAAPFTPTPTAVPPAPIEAAAAVMQAHLATMEQFLDVQRDIMAAFLAPSAPAADMARTPLLSEIVHVVPGESAEAIVQLDPAVHRYLADHEFGRRISQQDPALGGIPVVPFTVSLEMLAETASLLWPGLVVTGFAEVRGSRWITAHGGACTLRLHAVRRDGAPGMAADVRLFIDGTEGPAATIPVVEGTVLLGETYPVPPSAPAAMRGAVPHVLTPTRLYEDILFHGPRFRGIERVDAVSDAGLQAEVRILPRTELLAGNADPHFHADPVVLDVLGQAIGAWASARDDDRVCFPYRVGRITLYGPPLPADTRTTCTAAVARNTGEDLAGTITLVHDGRPVITCEDWQDRKFVMADALQRLLLDPAAVMLSTPWSLPGTTGGIAVHLDRDALGAGVLTSGGGIWAQVLATCVLSRAEQAHYGMATWLPARRHEWLLGRIALKDAVRQWLHARTGRAVAPADIEIRTTTEGAPFAWTADATLNAYLPAVSLSHAGPISAALASAPAQQAGIDIEPVSRVDRMTPELLRTVLQPAEAALVPDADAATWRLRLWCAKEAAAKACGIGLGSGLLRMRITAVEAYRGTVTVQRDPADGAHAPLVVTTSIDRGCVVAVCDQPATTASPTPSTSLSPA